MTAFLDLIKTLIPFAIAFLFLWGIGRICCTNSAAKKQTEQETTDETSDQDAQQQLKAQLKKKHQTKKRKELFAEKSTLTSGKQGLIDDQSNMFVPECSPNVQRDRTSAINGMFTLSSGKKQKRISLKQAFLLKEILDAPKAIKPYRSKYPR
jgi:hypothetical protein